MPTEELVVHAELVRHARQQRLTAPLLRATASAVATLPAVRDSASGRGKARQLKIVLVVIGLLVVLAGHQTWPVVACGLVLMAAAVPLPIPELTRRTLVNRLHRRRFRRVRQASPARLVHDGRRLILFEHDERLRRVLTNRPFRHVTHAGADGTTWLEIAPKSSKKKRDAIWIHVLDQAPPSHADTLAPDRPDDPVEVTAADVAPLARRLQEQAGTA